MKESPSGRVSPDAAQSRSVLVVGRADAVACGIMGAGRTGVDGSGRARIHPAIIGGKPRPEGQTRAPPWDYPVRTAHRDLEDAAEQNHTKKVYPILPP